MDTSLRTPWLRLLSAFTLICALILVPAGVGSGSDDTPTLRPGSSFPVVDEEMEHELLERDLAFILPRTAGDDPLDVQHAAQLRAKAAHDAKKFGKTAPVSGPTTFAGAWTQLGPAPIGEVTRSSFTVAPMNGRIGALAIRPSDGQIILGGAQGGIWLFNDGAGTWSQVSGDQETQSIGALAIAPSDDSVVYAGTGEGALSGDSYFGNGVLKSTDGGHTWSHVSGDYFQGVSISRVAVDPTDADHVYVAVLRGRGGARRVSPTPHSRFGLWESTDGGVNWNLLKEVTEDKGATDIEIDPQDPDIMYSSFWGDAIYKSTDAGHTWTPIMNFGLPNPEFPGGRFSLSISHPSPGGDGVLYAGFGWEDDNGEHPSRVWKSTDGGDSWDLLPAGDDGPQGEDDSVEDYCGEQCSYDNVIEANPENPDIVFAAGMFGYDLSPQSGGIFRSDDGGQTWKNLGWDQHPDFHAFAWDGANPGGVVVGSDGGVWYSTDLGGRPDRSDPLSDADWIDLNSGGLRIAQFTSIATNPTLPTRMWGGTQDNGTLAQYGSTWFDLASGDGGQVLVDPTDFHYVYGTYFGVTPYRYTDGGTAFFTNQAITKGINTGDRSEFYIPWVMNQDNPNQLFLGTYRLYRTDNAKATSAGDVSWKTISPDLSTGCAGIAPNGGRGCFISAIGVGGGDAVYTGSEEGLIYRSTDAQVNDNPAWQRVDTRGKGTPNRPIAGFAVDRSNYRVAYVAFNGYDAATPKTPGHVFKTTNGGATWVNISGNLPDAPVNSITLDPSFPNTLYAATEVGPFVTYNGGATWGKLGTGFPLVSIWQMNLDPSHRTLAAGTHGRAAFSMNDTVAAPALVLSKVDTATPVGAGSNLRYTLTLRNIGNAAATGVRITDPIPANTSYVTGSATDGGTLVSGRTDKVRWTGLSVAAGASKEVSFTVNIAPALKKKVGQIVNDHYKATSAEGPSTSGSPKITPIAPPYAVGLLPATQTDGAHSGASVDYPVTVRNLGSNTDSYTMSAAGGYQADVLDATCTSPLTTTAALAPGDTTNVCVRVTVPGAAPNDEHNSTTVTATSVGSPSVSGTSEVVTIAVNVDTLLVDGDTNVPVDSQPRYATALTDAGVQFSNWDLSADSDIPVNYMKAFKNIVWFTGNAYPGPLLPYEAKLKSFLDNGGRLFLSGQDLLDQAAGTTTFVHDYLHVTWDGSETQNDKGTANVHGVAGTLTDGIGALPLDHAFLQAAFEDRVTPNGGATPVFTDDAAQADGLAFSGSYKVVFVAFPFESIGTAADRADVVDRVMTYFGP